MRATDAALCSKKRILVVTVDGKSRPQLPRHPPMCTLLDVVLRQVASVLFSQNHSSPHLAVEALQSYRARPNFDPGRMTLAHSLRQHGNELAIGVWQPSNIVIGDPRRAVFSSSSRLLVCLRSIILTPSAYLAIAIDCCREAVNTVEAIANRSGGRDLPNCCARTRPC